MFMMFVDAAVAVKRLTFMADINLIISIRIMRIFNYK